MPTGNHGPVSSERAIENLISSYAFLNDDADIAGLGELFADAVFTLDETTARGREEIEHRARGLIQVNEDGASQTRHNITNLIIEVDEESDHHLVRRLNVDNTLTRFCLPDQR
jgi:hypothetical protein